VGGAGNAVSGFERAHDAGAGAPLEEVPNAAAGRCSLEEVGVEVGLLEIVDGGVVLVEQPAQELLAGFGDFFWHVWLRCPYCVWGRCFA
jgi:hypothetical protein